jgi:hypothetical protein
VPSFVCHWCAKLTLVVRRCVWQPPFLVRAETPWAREFETMNRIKALDYSFPTATISEGEEEGATAAPSVFPEAARSLVQALLKENPSERLGADAVGIAVSSIILPTCLH